MLFKAIGIRKSWGEKVGGGRWEVGEGNEQARDLAGLILAEWKYVTKIECKEEIPGNSWEESIVGILP